MLTTYNNAAAVWNSRAEPAVVDNLLLSRYGRTTMVSTYDQPAKTVKLYHVFLCYSHADKDIATDVVELLRGFGRRVFYDKMLSAGEKWRPAIRLAMTLSRSVCVLWCCHASRSSEVSEEIDIALHLRKRIVPYLLCDTPRKPCLEEWQHVTLKGVAHTCLPVCSNSAGADSMLTRELLEVAQLTSLEPEAVEQRVFALLDEGSDSMRQRAYAKAAVGLMLIGLIIIAPFPPAPSRTLSVAMNGLAGTSAGLLFVSASLFFRRRRRAFNIAATSGYVERLLAILIDALIRLMKRSSIRLT